MRASSHEPGCRDEFRLGFICEISARGFPGGKRPKILGMSSGAKFEKQSKHIETQKF